MKRILLLSLLAIPLFGICQQQKFKIKGEISGVSPKSKAYLVYLLGSKVVIDSARFSHCSFEFSGVTSAPIQASLVVGHMGVLPDEDHLDNQSVYLENGTVYIKGRDSLIYCKIWGTPLNLDNQEKVRLLKTIKGWREKEESKAMATFVSKHPASMVSLDWMSELGARNSTVIANYPKLSESLKKTKPGKELGMAVKTLLSIQIGQMAPDFTLLNQEGQAVKLSELRGKYVLLDFWASWCHPCRELQPKLVDLYNEFKTTGKFEILAVSLDKEQSAWLKAIKEDNVPWLQVADLNKPVNKAAQLYDVTIIPASFLIDPDGKIVGRGPNRELLKEKLLGSEISKTGDLNPVESMYDVKPEAVVKFFSKDKISNANILEDCNALNKILRQDIGEAALIKEIGALDMVKDSVAFYKLVTTKPAALCREKSIMKQQFVEDHPDSYLSLYELEDNNDMYSADSYAVAYEKLSDRLKKTFAAQGIRNRMEEWKNLTPTGKVAENFTRKDQYGKTIKLSDYRGKLVILDFWGSWCGACRQSHPHLKELYETYKNKGLEIIAIANENVHGQSKALKESKAAWLGAIKKDDVNWVHVLNDEGTGGLDIVKAYEITSYPTKILLDRDGKVLMRVSSLLNVEMDKLIKSILDK